MPMIEEWRPVNYLSLPFITNKLSIYIYTVAAIHGVRRHTDCLITRNVFILKFQPNFCSLLYQKKEKFS